MLMHRPMTQRACDKPQPVEMFSPKLTAEPFTPLSTRLKAKNAKVQGSLERLKNLISMQDFDQYIESLLNVSVDGKTVWMITDSPMQRSIMERNLISSIKDAFETDDVRILAS